MIRKDRMISFRLSDEEFRSLKMLCETNGSRSVSEVARVAIQKLVKDTGEVVPTDFATRLTLLDDEVARLKRLLLATDEHG